MKKLRKFVLLLVFVLIALLLSGCQESDESKYKNAQSLMAKGQYAEAAKKFDELGSYEEASKLSMYCKAAEAGENGDYETAFSTFNLLGDYKESQFMITYYQARQYESTGVSETMIQWNDLISAAQLYDSLAVFRDSKERAEACRQKVYDYAVECSGTGKYSDAIRVLNVLGQYSDSASLSQYYEAFRLEQEHDFVGASAKFTEISPFKDAKEQVEQVMQRGYDYAASLETNGDQLGAYNAFMSLGNYKDSFERACKPYYVQGETYRTNEEWNKAVEAFTQAGTYSDAATQILATYYAEGEAKRSAQDWDGAVDAFSLAGNYSDAADQINETRYQQASALESSGNQEEAFNLFVSLIGYSDSFDRAYKPYYDLGVEKRNAGEWENAVAAFERASTYSDAMEQVSATRYAEGEAKKEKKDWDGAAIAFTQAGDYSDAGTQASMARYAEGEEKRDQKDWDGAVQAFTQAGDYSDASTQVFATRYAEGEEKRTNKDWDGSETAFIQAGEYSDAKTQISITRYTEGEEKKANKDFEGAALAFEKAGDYNGAKDQSLQMWYQYAEESQTAGDINNARYGYMHAYGYKDSTERLIALQRSYDHRLDLHASSSLYGVRKDGGVYAVGSDAEKISRWYSITAISCYKGWNTAGLCKNGTVVYEGDYGKGTYKRIKQTINEWTDIVSIAAGCDGMIAVRENGDVVAAYANDNRALYENVVSLKNAIEVAGSATSYTSGDHFVVLHADGTVTAMGYSMSVEKGVCDVKDWKDIVAIVAGNFVTVGLRKDGTVVATGSISKSDKEKIESWRDIVAISGDGYKLMGLKRDGTVVITDEDYNVSAWKDVVSLGCGSSVAGLQKSGNVLVITASWENDWASSIASWNLN